jgi:hypothetical protein
MRGKSTTFADLPISITDHIAIFVIHFRDVGEENLGRAKCGSATPLLHVPLARLRRDLKFNHSGTD